MRLTTSLPRRTAVLGVALLVAGSLAACSTDGSDTAPSASGAGATAAADLDGTLRISTAGTPQTLDPALQKTTGEQPYTFLVYDRLTRISDDFTAEPMLATAWEFAKDGSSLTLTLRDDVTFHDGTPFDAAAVKANIERAQQVEGSTVKDALSGISAVEVVDSTTVRLDLSAGGAELPAVLASNVGEMISPQALADPDRDLSLDPGDSGSGPYVLEKLTPNEGATYQRADGYWDTEAQPVKTVELQYIAASSDRLNAVQAGQIDLAQITGTDVAAAQPLVDAGTIEGDKVWQASQMGVLLRATRPALKDVKVRQALNYAIDKASISNDFYAGNCTAATQSFPETHWAHSAEVDSLYSYDQDTARRLLDEAGVGDSLQLTVLYATGSTFEALAQVVQAQLQAVGVTATLVGKPQADAVAAFKAGEADALVTSIVAAADPSQLYKNFFTGGYELAADDGKLADAVAQANDPGLSSDERAAAYQAIALTVADAAWNVPICFSAQLWAHTAQVSGADSMGWAWAGIPDFGRVTLSK